jgi:hypothetical protein
MGEGSDIVSDVGVRGVNCGEEEMLVGTLAVSSGVETVK